MATALVRNAAARLLSANNGLGVARVAVVNSGHQIQVATLKATYGEKFPYPEPYPYWKKKYTYGSEFFDQTWNRFNENTVVIMVEGNVAVGKKDFAQRLAKAFDLKYFGPTPSDRHIIKKDNGFDPRMLNEMLPPDLRPYDMQRFLEDPNPSRGHAGRLQNGWYEEKFRDYCRALTHVLSTGQGVVVVRSPFSDQVFADAMKSMGYITPNYYKYYNKVHSNTVCELLKPHLTVYLDVPVNIIRKRINERNDPIEKNSQVLNDKFLSMIEKHYKERFLPQMRITGEVVEIDYAELADDMDMDVIVEEIQTMKFESDDNEDPKFRDWGETVEHDDWTLRRKNFQMDWWFDQYFNFLPPMECEEVYLTQDERDEYQRIVLDHPAMKYESGWAADLGDNIRFKV